MNLTTATAARKSTHDGQTAYSTQWAWEIDADTTALVTHSRPHRHGARGTYTTTILRWTPEAESPEVEEFGPEVSTLARALEWLNTTGMAALQA